mgnify:CR=1 FL=1
MANNRAHGKAIVKIDGKVFHSEKGSSLYMGGEKRTPKTSESGKIFYTGEIEPAKIEASFIMHGGMSLKDFDFTDALVEFGSDTGKTYIVRNGFSEGPADLQGEGTVKVTIYGESAEEIS